MRTQPPLPWLLMIGLASLALLWPLTALLGVPAGAPRALALTVAIAAAWIAVVGLGRVERPVLVLTLTGLGYGVILLIVAAVAGGGARPAPAYAAALVIDTLRGTVAGLLALAAQRAIGPRRDTA